MLNEKARNFINGDEKKPNIKYNKPDILKIMNA
jgi:hypothetical protein